MLFLVDFFLVIGENECIMLAAQKLQILLSEKFSDVNMYCGPSVLLKSQ